MQSEIWKDIAGYEGRYLVSSLGRVKSLRRGKEKILKPHPNNRNYLQVGLYKDKTFKPLLVHRLVAAAFIPNPSNLPMVNHRDENPSNNHVDNLEWCDAQYNVNYGTAKKKMAEKLSKKIDQFTLAREFVQTWPSMRQIWRELGIGAFYCCKGKCKSAGGFVWKYHVSDGKPEKEEVA